MIVFDIRRYVQFLEKAIIDGRIRRIEFKLDDHDYSVSAIIPHFWNQIGTLPLFSLSFFFLLSLSSIYFQLTYLFIYLFILLQS